MKLMIKIIVAVIAVAMLIVFMIPVAKGIINSGNITGIAVSILMLLGVIFFSKIGDFASTHKAARTGFIILEILIGVIAILAIITSVFIFRGANKKPEDNSVVVVLGCAVKGDKPSLMLGRRINAAADYLKKNPDTLCIVSGGKGSGENISEAECMKRELVKLGISEDRIYLEDKSTSTRENIEFSRKILDEIVPGAPVTIVTNEFHQYRAGLLCDANGLSHGSVCSETSWWLWPTYHVREMYAVLAAWVTV